MKALLLGGPKGGERKELPICRWYRVPVITLNGAMEHVYEATMQLEGEELLTIYFYKGVQ